MNRLLICAVMLAYKFHEESYWYPSEHYSKVGGIPRSLLLKLEKYFVQTVDFNLLILEEEVMSYA